MQEIHTAVPGLYLVPRRISGAMSVVLFAAGTTAPPAISIHAFCMLQNQHAANADALIAHRRYTAAGELHAGRRDSPSLCFSFMSHQLKYNYRLPPFFLPPFSFFTRLFLGGPFPRIFAIATDSNRSPSASFTPISPSLSKEASISPMVVDLRG